VEYLLNNGANPNVQERSGLTPLHWAASHGNLQAVRILVAAGACPDMENSCGQTAAMLAQRRGKSEITQFLEGLGVSVSGP
jgi:ankyrin repeat protein